MGKIYGISTELIFSHVKVIDDVISAYPTGGNHPAFPSDFVMNTNGN